MDMKTIEKLEGTMPETNLAKNWSEQMTDYYKNIEIRAEAERVKHNKSREQKFQETVLEMFSELKRHNATSIIFRDLYDYLKGIVRNK